LFAFANLYLGELTNAINLSHIANQTIVHNICDHHNIEAIQVQTAHDNNLNEAFFVVSTHQACDDFLSLVSSNKSFNIV